MGLVVVGVQYALVGAQVEPGLRLLALVVVGTVAYVPLVAWRAPEVWSTAHDLRRRRNAMTTAQTLASS
jgi:hypothetical protein